ncbi:MAG: 2-dehydro-3-deoxygalactonokinase [Planctomycetota bacterium]|jgi:2-dehydro-3-deoxygalactonokinase|nr:2-dehydro-3-deoxygalactonokinase [Planctomycetota bacterium]
MFAVIDCGTTNTRIFIIDDKGAIAAFGERKVGVRDTSITGSRDALRQGVGQLFHAVLRENGIGDETVSFAIASGMITSEIGLIELPHLVAPVGLAELSHSVVKVEDPEILPIERPVYFIRGVHNNYAADAGICDLRKVDFMRGEEVQCVGILADETIRPPCSIVALSSHTKIMYIDSERRIAASNTTISGQLYEALVGSTNIGKSIVPTEGEAAGGYGYEELVETAMRCVEHAGLGRTLLMPRFMQVLMKSNGEERNIFVNAAIAADDLKAFKEMRDFGLASERYILYGKRARCEMYDYMLRKRFGADLRIDVISDKAELGMLTVRGAVLVAGDILAAEK